MISDLRDNYLKHFHLLKVILQFFTFLSEFAEIYATFPFSAIKIAQCPSSAERLKFFCYLEADKLQS